MAVFRPSAWQVPFGGGSGAGGLHVRTEAQMEFAVMPDGTVKEYLRVQLPGRKENRQNHGLL